MPIFATFATPFLALYYLSTGLPLGQLGFDWPAKNTQKIGKLFLLRRWLKMGRQKSVFIRDAGQIVGYFPKAHYKIRLATEIYR